MQQPARSVIGAVNLGPADAVAHAAAPRRPWMRSQFQNLYVKLARTDRLPALMSSPFTTGWLRHRPGIGGQNGFKVGCGVNFK
jgi:hypothetical protein